MKRQYKTNLRCESCVSTIAPVLDADPTIKRWQADVSSLNKTLTVEGDSVTTEHVSKLMNKAGYQVLGEIEAATTAPMATEEGEKRSYYPLLLILAYLLGVVGLVEWAAGSFQWMRAMNHFMAGFFLVFSFFKLLNLQGFADAYSTYDILAKRSRVYALAYPFIELALGVAYLTHFQPFVTNLVTLGIMAISTVGVVQSLLAQRKIRCACLGTVFNLPMSVVTLTEDVLMAGMAAVMLFNLAG
jgi:copper chaperone CopZ